MLCKTRRAEPGRWLALAAYLVLAVGCSPSVTRVGPAASAVSADAARGNTAAGPQASLLAEDDPNALPVSSTIRKVTVYSDRALVSREATIKLALAPTVYVFKQLPGWVDEGSVRAATSSGRIVDVRVVRSYLARANERSFLEAEAANRELTSQLLALDDELKVLDAQAKQVEDIKAFSLSRLNDEVASGSPPASSHSGTSGSVGVGTYEAVVEFIGKKMREVAKGRRKAQALHAKLAPEVEASKRRLDELRSLTQLEETKVFVTVQAGGGALPDGQLQLTYMLPGATWESAHELRAESGDPTAVEVTSYAVVSQASGEDWDRAELTFSTQSSTAAVRIPELEALTLGETRATSQTIETRSASFKRAEAAFKGQNRLWNKRVQSSDTSRNFEESYQSNFESLQVTQSKTVQIFQSLQQRGTTAQFKAMSTTNVRADGRSVRVPIGHGNLKAKKAIVAAPEQSLNAAQTLDLLNDSGQSLLPGNVALYQAGAFLGVTNLDFVADGENFALFLSVADQLKLSRVLDKKRSALVRKQRTQMQLAFVVSVENLSNKAMTLNLADRIPVSEDRDVLVSGVKIGPDAKPDSKGILRWLLTLQPKEKRKFEIQYQIEYPPSLILEAKRNAAKPGPEPELPSPAALSPRRAYDIKRDIEQLESTF